MSNNILPEYRFAENVPSSISFHMNQSSSDEMLRISPEGFYVRGVKVPIDDKEALSVYNTFHQWLMWTTLNRNY